MTRRHAVRDYDQRIEFHRFALHRLSTHLYIRFVYPHQNAP
jgi:hypothetical protein